MECAGIADLTGGSNLGRAVRLAAEDVGRVAAEDRNSGLAVRVILKEILGHSRDRSRRDKRTTSNEPKFPTTRGASTRLHADKASGCIS